MSGGDSSAKKIDTTQSDSKETSKGTKLHVVRPETFRQTRFNNESGLLRLELNKKSCVVRNWSRTGIAFDMPKTDSVPSADSTLESIAVTSNGIEIYSGALKVVSVRESANDVMTVACKFTDNLFFVEGVHAANIVSECAQDVQQGAHQIMNSSAEFCRLLLSFNSALKKFEKACEIEEKRWKNLSFDQKAEAEKVFLPNMSNAMREAFVDLDIQMAKLIDVESLPEKSVYHQLVNEQIYPFFERADLSRRAYEKPRGYAGDYEMMNQIYRSSYEGSDLFGKVLHNYITNEHSGDSVKFRKPYLHQKIRDQLKQPGLRRILSIASGPAVEFQEAVGKWSQEELDRVQMNLFDLDREALEHAQTKIMEIASIRGVTPNVNYINASVKSFLVSSAHSTEKFDLIYSAGLFDYLDNATSTALTHKFFNMLNPQGTLLIGNFTKDNLTKAFLHLIVNWTLIHKTQEEILNWANSIKNCSKKLEFDTHNMIAFLILEKNGDS